jgi:drug/metabolite transporter (DMT)-like permease
LAYRHAAPAPRAVPLSAIGLLLLIAVLWGINWPILKVGVSEIPPFAFRTVTGFAAAAGLFLIARLAGQPLAVPRRERVGIVVVAILNMTLWNVFILFGVQAMSSGRAAIIGYTMPLWATLAAFVLVGERLTWKSITALALGLAALGLLFAGDSRALESGPLGPALVLCGAVAWGIGTGLQKYYAFTMPVTVITAWQQLIGAVPVVVIALAWDVHHLPEEFTLGPILALVYNMTATSIVCYWAFFKVVSMLPVVVSSVGTLLVPVVGVAADALYFRTVPGPVDYIALVLVLAAVVLVMRPARRGG